MRIKAGVHFLRVTQAQQKQSRAHKRDQADSHLNRYKNIAQTEAKTAAFPAQFAAGAFFQLRHQIRPRRLHRRSKPEYQPCANGNQQSKGHHVPVKRKVHAVGRKLRRTEAPHEITPCKSQTQTEQASAHGQHHGFREQLRNNASA